MSAGIGAVATKAVAGIAAAALVTAGAVEVDSSGRHLPHPAIASVVPSTPEVTAPQAVTHHAVVRSHPTTVTNSKATTKATAARASNTSKANAEATSNGKSTAASNSHAVSKTKAKTPPPPPPGRTVTTTDSTKLQTASCAAAPVALEDPGDAAVLPESKRGKGWLIAAGLVILAIGLTALGVWFLARQSERAPDCPPDAGAAATPAPDLPWIPRPGGTGASKPSQEERQAWRQQMRQQQTQLVL